MNWSGGYKSRIRSRALALSRKGTYHQKNQIMLVDHVGERYERDSELNKQDNKMEMNSDISTPTHKPTDKWHMSLQNQQKLQTPFANIPYGTSSDSEESEYDKNGEYDQCSERIDTELLHSKSPATSPALTTKSEFSENEEPENFTSSLDSMSSTPRTVTSPYQDYKNESFTSDLRFLTPIVLRGKKTELSPKCAEEAKFEENLRKPHLCSAYSTPIQLQKKTHLTPQNNSTYSDLTVAQTPVPTNDCPPTLRKQVRFAETVQGMNEFYEIPPCSSSSPNETILSDASLSPIIPYDYRADKESVQQDMTEKKTEQETITGIQEHCQELCFPEVSENTKDCSMPKTNEVIKEQKKQGTKQRINKKHRLGYWKAKPFYRKSNQEFHIPCHCRTVERRIKIRDAETQTSP